LISLGTADLLRQRYQPPAPPKPVEAPTIKPIAPPAPKPTLAQTLLSEASIKVFLYLGAFFVIAALYLDGGLGPASAFVRRYWTPLLALDLRPPKDAKTALQEWAQARGLPVVWTYHTPTLSCARGTMMRFGTMPCDGEFRAVRCTACASHALSGSRLVAGALAAVPTGASALLGRALPGRLGTALGSRARQVACDAGFRAAMAEADCIVAVCDWVRAVLLANGLPAERIVVSRQGLVQAIAAATPRGVPAPRGPLRIAYFGRIDLTKGVNVLIEALAAIPHVSVRLDIHGVVQPGAEHAFLHAALVDAAQPVDRGDVEVADQRALPQVLAAVDVLGHHQAHELRVRQLVVHREAHQLAQRILAMFRQPAWPGLPAHTAAWLLGLGWAVASQDHRGFGRSEPHPAA